MQNEGPSSFGGSDLLQQEYQRVKSKQPMPPIDSHRFVQKSEKVQFFKSRYTLSPPPLELQNDPAAWKAALDNAYAQLEHQQLRQISNRPVLVSYLFTELSTLNWL